MSNAKHTPGPWEAVEHSQRIGLSADVQRIPLAGRWRIIAEARKVEIRDAMGGEAPECDLIAVLPAMSDANARLIEIAPEMAEGMTRAKRTITYLLSCCCPSDITDQEREDAMFIAALLKRLEAEDE